MKNAFPYFLFVILLSTSPQACGQLDSGISRMFSIGITAGEFGDDPEVGLEISSPSFFKEKLMLRAKGSITWLEAYKAQYNHWSTFTTIKTSLVYNFNSIERTRPYLELGITFVFPDTDYSHVRALHGIDGLAGAELFVATKRNLFVCYFFSLGACYTRAYADKIENKPRYATGFAFSNGFRFYF